MDAAEAAVAEDANDVAASSVPRDLIHNRIGIRQTGGGFVPGLQLPDQARGIEPFSWRQILQARHLRYQDGIGVSEGGEQVGLENAAPGGVGAGLEHGQDFLARVLDKQSLKGLANGARVMAEVTHNGHRASNSAYFDTTID